MSLIRQGLPPSTSGRRSPPCGLPKGAPRIPPTVLPTRPVPLALSLILFMCLCYHMHCHSKNCLCPAANAARSFGSLLNSVNVVILSYLMSTREQLFLPADRPYESRQFPRHGRHCFPLVLPPADQPIEPAVQPLLRLPRNRKTCGTTPTFRSRTPRSSEAAAGSATPILPVRAAHGHCPLCDRTLTAMRA